MAIDTDLEKELDLGASWPFEALDKDECIISTKIAQEGDFKINDTIKMFTYGVSDKLNQIVYAYNE